MQNRTFLVHLRPSFARKMKTSPPIKGFGSRSCEGVAMLRTEEFLKFEILATKSVSISVKTFFFLEITYFWAEKTLGFEISAEKSVSILLTLFSTFQKRLPPLTKSWLRACTQQYLPIILTTRRTGPTQFNFCQPI